MKLGLPHSRTLGAAVAGLSALAAVHGALPFPYTGDVLAELLVGVSLALVLFACACDESEVRLGQLALVCGPVAASAMLDPEHRVLAVMAGLSFSAVVRPGFWTGAERGSSAPFALALLTMTVLQGAHLVRIGATAETSYDADAFYYFGLARHWVVEGRFEDHMLWHFLSPSAEVVHPVGDYWQPMTSLVIAPWMWIFGATHAVAGAAIAGFSLLGSIGLWHLLTARAIVRHRAVQAAILMAYGSNTQLERFRIDAETQGVVATLCILAMVAMSHRRWGIAIALATCLAFTRTDASVTAATLVACSWLAARPDERGRVGAFIVGAAAFYVTSHLVRFGTWGPPAAARAPLLATYQDLYAYHPQLLSGAERLALVLAALPTSLNAATAVLFQYPFALARGAGVYASFVAWGAWAREASLDAPRRAVVASSILISLAVPTILISIAGPVFNEGRTYQGLIGAMHVAFAYAADRALRLRAAPEPMTALLGLGLLAFTLSTTTLAQERTSQRIGLSMELRELSAELEGHVVLTELSWWVGAETDADAVIHTPIGREADVVEVVERWRPDLFLAEPASCPVSLARVIPGDSFVEARLGDHRLVPVRRGTWYRLYRIEPAEGAAPTP